MRDDLREPADDERHCQQCGRPCHWTETLCEDCRYPDGDGDGDGEQAMSEYRYTEHEGRTGIWAQGEGVSFPDVPPGVPVHALYREGLRLAEIAVRTGPGIDGLAARAARKEAIALRAALLALVAIPPLRCHEMRYYCHHCGAHLPDGNSGHADDCAWVRACELVAGQRDSEE